MHACGDRTYSVFPTLADTFPLVVLEAMSHGKAVIASEVGGIPYQLKGGCGVLVPAGNPRRLAEAITQLGSNRTAISAMGQAGRKKSQDAFTWESAAETAMAGYEQILSRAASSKQRAFPVKRFRPNFSAFARH